MKKIARKVKNVSVAHPKRLLKHAPASSKKVIIKTVRIAERVTGLAILPNTNDYQVWLKNHKPKSDELTIQVNQAKKLKYKPLISIVTPVYNTPPKLLQDCIQSVIDQTYSNWELILVDDCSPSKEPIDIINKYAKLDTRIKALFNKTNMHISDTTNKGIKVAKGEYIALLDHDDVIYPHALFSIVKSLQTKRHDFIYSDEDKLSENGKHRSNPFFKPDWSPDFLRSINYITHFTVIKKTLIKKVGGFRSEYNGAQDWDLFLRATKKAQSIHHIPDVLYGWRMISTSTAQDSSAKPYVVDAQKNALLDDANDREYEVSVTPSKYNKDFWHVTYKVIGNPLVSIVIPTKNQYNIVKRCVESIINKSTYNNYEIIIIDTGSDDQNVLNWYKNIKKNKNIKLFNWVEPKFSYANSCNYGAKQAKGDYLIMLNNDTEVITPNWIELMIGDAQRPEVGTVGVRLYYPGNKYIQHAGVGVGLGGYAANIMSNINKNNLTVMQYLYGNNKRNVACNTAACLMLKQELFNKVGGFDYKFSVTYNDVDLGLKILKKGYLNIYNPNIELTHHESISLGKPENKKRNSTEFTNAKKMLKAKWYNYIKHDPYYCQNFNKNYADFTIIT